MANWYSDIKEAAFPALMPKRRFPDAENAKVQLFNYLKTKKLAVHLFHATSLATYKLIQKSGFIIAPAATGKGDSKADTVGTNNIYFTPDKSFAQSMLGFILTGTDDPDTSTGVLLKVKVPIWMIEEVVSQLFDQGTTGGDQLTGEKAVEYIMQGEFEKAKAFARVWRPPTKSQMCDLLPKDICKKDPTYTTFNSVVFDDEKDKQLVQGRSFDDKIKMLLNHVRWEKLQGKKLPTPGEYTVHDVIPAKYIEDVEYVGTNFEYDALRSLANYVGLGRSMQLRPGVLNKAINDLVYALKTSNDLMTEEDGSLQIRFNGDWYPMNLPPQVLNNVRVKAAINMRFNSKIGPNVKPTPIPPAVDGVDSLDVVTPPTVTPSNGAKKTKAPVDKQLSLF